MFGPVCIVPLCTLMQCVFGTHRGTSCTTQPIKDSSDDSKRCERSPSASGSSSHAKVWQCLVGNVFDALFVCSLRHVCPVSSDCVDNCF